jgi:hypothetical protein
MFFPKDKGRNKAALSYHLHILYLLFNVVLKILAKQSSKENKWKASQLNGNRKLPFFHIHDHFVEKYTECIQNSQELIRKLKL